MWMCVQGQRSMLNVLLDWLALNLIFWDRFPHWTCCSLIWLECLDSKRWGPSCLNPLPPAGIINTFHQVWLFRNLGSEDWTQVFMILRQALYWLSRHASSVICLYILQVLTWEIIPYNVVPLIAAFLLMWRDTMTVAIYRRVLLGAQVKVQVQNHHGGEYGSRQARCCSSS